MTFKQRLITLFALFLLIGCNGEQEQATQNPDFTAAIVTTDMQGVKQTTFAQGDPITIQLTILNRSKEIRAIEFTSGQQYDFVVFDAMAREVWRWSADKAFIQAVTSYSLNPGKTKIFSVIWNQVIAPDRSVLPPGTYTLEAQKIGVELTPRHEFYIQ